MSEGQNPATPPETPSDPWFSWLLRDRHGADPAIERAMRADVDRYADRVLDAARPMPGMTLADIGTGDGLVAFRAIERVGPTLEVLFVDVSAALLRHAEALAAARGLLDQCVFLERSAADLHGIGDASVDVLTTRAALAYVPDKRAALREFHRVLKPGGRVSIAEPVLRDDALSTMALRQVLEARGEACVDPILPLIHRWKAAQFPDTPETMADSPIANYSERDLLVLFREIGFGDIHLELHIDVGPEPGMPWEAFVASSPHPWAPTLQTILRERFAGDERELFERQLRPLVEAGSGDATRRIVYLNACKAQATGDVHA